MRGIHLRASGFQGTHKLHPSGAAIHNTHGSSHRLRLAPLHSCCCPCWAFMVPASHLPPTPHAIPSVLCYTFTHSLSWALVRDSHLPHGARPQLLFLTASDLRPLLQLRPSLHQQALLGSRDAKSPLFSMASSCLGSRYHRK